MAKRVLVPLDMTVESALILPIVADIARGTGATVRLLNVAAPMDNVVADDGLVVAYADQETTRVRLERLDALQALEIEVEDVPVESVVRFGNPLEEILREAEEFGADLIAVSTRCRSSLKRGLLGGLAEALVRRSGVDVLLLRPGEPGRGAAT